MPTLLVAVLVDELCQRICVHELTEKRMATFETLAEALVRAKAGQIPEDVEEACTLLLPELILKAGVKDNPGALYPTELYKH